MHFGRYLPLFLAVSALILLEIYLIKSKFIFIALPLIGALIVYAAIRMAKHSLIDKAWWNIIILPIIFSAGLAVYSVLLPLKENVLSIQFLLILNSVFLYFYFRSVYFYLILPSAERKISLENISLYGSFLSIFFVSSAMYGFQSFINTPIFILIAAFLFASALLVYGVFWSNNISLKKGSLYILICCLILTELAWSIFYLPFNFNVAGFILAMYFYILTGLNRAFLQNRLNVRVVKMYLGLGMFSIFLILITSRWL